MKSIGKYTTDCMVS